MDRTIRSLLPGLVLLATACGPDPASTDTASTGLSSGPTDTSGTVPGQPTSTTVDPSATDPASTTGAGGSASSSSAGGSSSTSTGDASSSTGDASSSTGDASSSTGDGAPPNLCRGGLPLFQLPDLTVDEGLEECSDGQIHRHTAVECLHPFPVALCADPGKCKDPCDEHGDGVCNTHYEGTCTCRYPCTSDADCQPDAACLCNGGRPVDGGYNHYITTTECVRADCRTDADCGEFLCALSPGVCGFGSVLGLFCHTAADECVSDAECSADGLGNLCMFEPAEQRWSCTEQALCL